MRILIILVLAACTSTVPANTTHRTESRGDAVGQPIIAMSAVTPPDGGPVMATDDGIVIYRPDEGWVPMGVADE